MQSKYSSLNRYTSLKKTAFKKSTNGFKRSTLRPVSKKRSVQNKEYTEIRKWYLFFHPICEACDISRSTTIHHKKGRIGKLLTDAEFFMATCMDCHGWIETHKEAARAKGWRLDRLAYEPQQA